MKIMLTLFLFSSFSTFAFRPLQAFAIENIQEGVYKLKGSNPDGIKKYEGRIVIQREGINYRITWFIGVGQKQMGIGLLEDNVLSIGYMDMTGQDFGVVSLKVINDKLLKGRWSSIFSKGSFGEEEFNFETDKIPPELLPKPVKKNPATKELSI